MAHGAWPVTGGEAASVVPYIWYREPITMTLSHHPRTDSGSHTAGTLRALLAAGAGLPFAAALLLWWRFGPSVFVDGLNAAWTCL